MYLKINHTTAYSYSEPVFLEPHYLYLYPSQKAHQKTLSFSLNIFPQPAGVTLKQDPENNIYKQCWFNELVSNLTIELELEMISDTYNPFDFFMEKWPDRLHPALEPYLKTEALDTEIQNWINGISIDGKKEPIEYLSWLNRETNKEFEHEIRYEETLHSPQECFRLKKGSCRDLSWMLIHVLRNQGIPARFISGYAFNPELEEGHELHAWLEAWLPGAGWIGIDPSAGIFINEQYIPLAESFHPENTLPVQGKYRGDAQSKLHTAVHIEEV